LVGVECVSRTNCVAVGGYGAAGFDYVSEDRPLIERWNGVRWSLDLGPVAWKHRLSALAGVSCNPGGCVAVGTDFTEAHSEPLIVRSTTPS
jgi:hypothetical protein